MDDADDVPEPTSDLRAVAEALLLDLGYLSTIEKLLEDKRQVIFQGPPGTGKTYVARQLALCLAGSAERVGLVQFHPSYAYEDFVQGFRPSLKEGQPGFGLRNGPLVEAAERARKEPNARHRRPLHRAGRLGATPAVSLRGVPPRPAAGPRAARALAGKERSRHDLGRRRVDRANERLDDRQAAIGPSYFMKDHLDEETVRLIWQHSVLPYLEERLYGEPDRLGEFELDKLRGAEPDGGALSNDATD